MLPADQSHGGVDFSFSRAGFHFVGFPTFNPPGMSHVVGKGAMAKVAQFLESHRADPVILLCHSPLVTAEGGTDSWEVPDNTVQVLQVLARCGNVVAVLCGHNHGFWTCVKDGILHASGPGFCEALGASTYAFLVWHVYADRMTAQVYYVNDEDEVVGAPKLGVAHQWRSALRGEHAEHLDPRLVVALPASPSPILEQWFGLDWIYAPGYALPPSWREDITLLPGQKAKAAVQIELPRDQLPAPDAQGHDWQDPDYTPGKAWQTCTAPARYWDHTKPRAGHRHLFFRVALDCDPATLKRLRRCAVKLMQYRSPQVFINGTKVWMPGGNMHAERWNGHAVIDPQLLRPEGNVLACRLTTAGWGGYQFDVEVSGELRY